MKKLLSLKLSVVFLPSFTWVKELIRPSKTPPPKTVKDLVLSAPFDKVDRKKNYLNGTDMSFWHRQIHPVLTGVLPKLKLPEEGVIMEIGVYQGDSFRVLSEVFGADRVRGIDLCKYVEDPRILNVDVRLLRPEHDMPLALAWNDVSNWKGSPRSKKAAFDYALRNLVLHGLYIDESLKDLPADLPLKDFKLVHSQDNVSVFRRVRVS